MVGPNRFDEAHFGIQQAYRNRFRASLRFTLHNYFEVFMFVSTMPLYFRCILFHYMIIFRTTIPIRKNMYERPSTICAHILIGKFDDVSSFKSGPGIAQLPMLQTLDVHDNQISRIDDAIAELRELRMLNLGNCVHFNTIAINRYW